jgi:two-component system, OmpR family, response regulator
MGLSAQIISVSNLSEVGNTQSDANTLCVDKSEAAEPALQAHRPREASACRLLFVEFAREDSRELAKKLDQVPFALYRVMDPDSAFAELTSQELDAVLIVATESIDPALKLIRRIRSHSLGLPILVITPTARPLERVLVLNTGADDCLDSPFEFLELQARIRALVRRTTRQARNAICFGPLTLVPGDPRVTINGLTIDLPPSEFIVLQALAMRAGHVLSRSVITAQLGRGRPSISDAAVEVAVCRLRRRLSLMGLKVRTHRGFGYALEVAENAEV